MGGDAADAVEGHALAQSRGLVDFLVELTSEAVRDPVLDICADVPGKPEDVLWLDELAEHAPNVDMTDGERLLQMPHPPFRPEPAPPAAVADWVERETSDHPEDAPPRLRETAPLPADHHSAGAAGAASPDLGHPADGEVAPPPEVKRAFEQWLPSWESWAEQQRRSRRARWLYTRLEHMAKQLDQRDDEVEVVLATCLVRWQAPDGRAIRRHLVTEQVQPSIRSGKATIEVLFTGARRRVEDGELFGGLDDYRPERAHTARSSLIEGVHERPEDKLAAAGEFLDRTVAAGAVVESEHSRKDEPPTSPGLSLAPALVLRRRSKAQLAEAYQRIARELRSPGAPVPVSLAQLVVDTEPAQRERWLVSRGRTPGNVLGEDPLFPLPANGEQERVMELLGAENGVVVQGPPGTGKTHTIANLVSALLARGQRVLVTSQKDQALRVLRDKIPAELRMLCVLLTGGSKDASRELERSVEALSEAVAANDPAALKHRLDELEGRRFALCRRSAELNKQIIQAREVEYVEHAPLAAWFDPSLYRGTLGQIVKDLKANEDRHHWFPAAEALPEQPPLSAVERVELLRLLRSPGRSGASRLTQQIPKPEELPTYPQLVELVRAEREAEQHAAAEDDPWAAELASLGPGGLDELSRLAAEVTGQLRHLGFAPDGTSTATPAWIEQAVTHFFAGRRRGLWQPLLEQRRELRRLQDSDGASTGQYVVAFPNLDVRRLGVMQSLLIRGRELADSMSPGQRLRSHWRGRRQRDAGEFLAAVEVNNGPPRTREEVQAAVDRLASEIAVRALAERWTEVGVDTPPGSTRAVLAELVDRSETLATIETLAEARRRVTTLLAEADLTTPVQSLEEWLRLLHAVPAARSRLIAEQARATIEQLVTVIRQQLRRDNVCPELATLAAAIEERDLDRYASGLDALVTARAEQEAERRRQVLSTRLDEAHPSLYDALLDTVDEPVWDERMTELAAAWAWASARAFVARSRNADIEHRLVGEFGAVEDQLAQTTAQLAGTRATLECLKRMTDDHARALRSYREHMSKVGAGYGKRTRHFQAAAREAIEKAREAVPAWVVALPNLLDNLAPERDAFDVVIVDEASQVGFEQLFLLWLAPRVIVVGDDKQCTPGDNRLGKLERCVELRDTYLPELDRDIRENLTPKSHLYGLLSARSGRDSVVRLREHFRCVPEIIHWSSTHFYGEPGQPGLVALRERRPDALEPLRVVHLSDGYTDGRQQRIRNPVEAKEIAEQLAACVTDPAYRDKTFGVVVLQGTGQVRLLDHEINARVSPEQRQERRVRVGTPADFQGDERDVVFLSMVVANTPPAQQATQYQQAYNVAASRARDQLWLFTSVRADELKPEDLRRLLLDHMTNPPEVFGPSPSLDDVSDTQPCKPFDSLFEQRVFRALRGRGYHVVPQYPVGTRHLDLVVANPRTGARLDVECDGHYWHTSPKQTEFDARRDRELRRMQWDVVRVRESEFEFDPERELSRVLAALAARDIHPQSPNGHEEQLDLSASNTDRPPTLVPAAEPLEHT